MRVLAERDQGTRLPSARRDVTCRETHAIGLAFSLHEARPDSPAASE